MYSHIASKTNSAKAVLKCIIGVDTKFKGEFYEVLLSVSHVPELNRVQEQEQGLQVGAAVSLNILKHKLNEMVDKLPGEWTSSNC